MNNKKENKMSSQQNDSFNYNEDTWTIIESYFKNKKNLVKHHIESYHNFIENKIPEILNDFSPVEIPADYDEASRKFLTKYQVNFGNIYMSKPVINENDGTTRIMYPNNARLRNLSYSAPLFCDITHRIVKLNPNNNEEEIVEFTPLMKFTIGKMPIMLQSKYCVLNEQNGKTRTHMGEGEYDEGGYFIIKGSEKIIVAQEKKRPNKIFVFEQPRKISKFSNIAEISSLEDGASIAKNVQVKLLSKEIDNVGRTIRVQINRFKTEIPLFAIFRCLGIISDKDIVQHIIYSIEDEQNKKFLELLMPSIIEASPIQSEKLALEYISSALMYKTKINADNDVKLKYVQDILLAELLPHVGESKNRKGWFLGLMVNKLLKQTMGLIQPDDRDSFINKRVETTGDLMTGLFRVHFSKMIKDLRSSIEKDIKQGRIMDLSSTLNKKIKTKTIEQGIKYALSTGNWGLKNQENKKGIAQLLNRLSYASSLSHCRRIIAPIQRSGKLTEPRKLHNSQWGYICPCESPEGGSIGIVKNMSLMTHITTGSNADIVYSVLEEEKVVYLESITASDVLIYPKIMVNGNWIGIHKNPEDLFTKLKNYKLEGIFNIYTSISWIIQEGIIEILTDPGRLCRPLYIVKNNKIQITKEIVNSINQGKLQWDDLCANLKEHKELKNGKGVIEYVDNQESDNIMIAMFEKNLLENKKTNDTYYTYTHAEIHPSMILGALVSNVPFPDHNQAPRNVYQAAMGKQAMGIYNTNFLHRLDTLGHILYYSQKPLVSSRVSSFVNSDELPSGMNPIIAIATYTGYNQEDSLIFNKSSVQRGLYASSYYRTVKAEEKRNASSLEDEKFTKPEQYYEGTVPLQLKTRKMQGNYDKLNEDGFIKEGADIKENDVIIGKVVPLKSNTEDNVKFKDSSVVYKGKEPAVADWVYSHKNSDGYNFCKVRLRMNRIPTTGDKYASRHGQKGTIGILYSQEEMPFSDTGLVPDIIMNPLALPSRMTIAHLIECAMSKIGVNLGASLDATPFTGADVNNVGKVLEKIGFHKSGKQVLYNGKTGEQIEADIFIGPTFYYKLKHMVTDKIHSRASGPYQLMTRQPAEGRSRDGGLRIGEMEKDCMLTHGSMQFLKERMYDFSDKFFIHVCKDCGFIAIVNPNENIYRCNYCEHSTGFSRIKIPYASKLFIQEMMSIGITPRIKTSNI